MNEYIVREDCGLDQKFLTERLTRCERCIWFERNQHNDFGLCKNTDMSVHKADYCRWGAENI